MRDIITVMDEPQHTEIDKIVLSNVRGTIQFSHIARDHEVSKRVIY